MDERQLVHNASEGDVKAFEEIVLQYEKTVYNIAFYMFKNEQDAYDMSQEVFIKIYKNLNKFNFESSLSTWINRITKNTCIDEIRKRKKRENDISMDRPVSTDDGEVTMQFEDHDKTPEEKMMLLEDKDTIIESIKELKEEYRLVIILRHIKEYSYDEISDILKINKGTVKSRLARGRRQLKDIILQKRELP